MTLKVLTTGDESTHACELPDLNWGVLLPAELKDLRHGTVVECECGEQYRWHQSIGWQQIPMAERLVSV